MQDKVKGTAKNKDLVKDSIGDELYILKKY